MRSRYLLAVLAGLMLAASFPKVGVAGLAWIAPGLMLGGTDSRHFEALSDNIYKFSPVRAGPQDLPRFHGTNERISIANYVEMIQFYCQLLRGAQSLG